MQKPLIILPSELMDGNKKPDRSENQLVRMSKITRDNVQAKDNRVLLTNADTKKQLEIYKAFTQDMIRVRQLVLEGAIEHEDMTRIGFVSSETFKTLGGKDIFLDLGNIPIVKPKEVAKFTIDKLLIGTDPELLLMAEDKVVNASGIAGFTKTSPFGYDGPMAEMRPDPAFTAEGLVANLKKIMQDEEVLEKVHALDLVSSCYHEDDVRDYPVGTHIHIDNPKQIANLSTFEKNRLFAVTNKIIDEFLTLPMIRLDGPKGHNRRAKCKMSMANNFGANNYGKGYGYFGEWRGDKGRLEHRSLSGLVLTNPKIATAVFGTAQAIAEAVYNTAIQNKLDPEFILPSKMDHVTIYRSNFKSWGKIPLAGTLKCTLSSKDVASMMDASDREIISPAYIKQWLLKIRELPTYGKFTEHIEALGDILSASDKALDSLDTKIKQTWKD